MGDHLKFLGGFLRNPFAVGAIAPSSRWLADLMVEDMRLDDADTVVELGPGTGSFTRAIDQSVSAEALFLALELNEQFAREIEGRFPRAVVINDSAEHLGTHLEEHERQHADSIVCGLPWASFAPKHQDAIMSSVVEHLRPGGRFATFAYVHAAWFPTARKFSRRLRENFPKVERTRVVWRNLPPAFVYRCEK